MAALPEYRLRPRRLLRRRRFGVALPLLSVLSLGAAFELRAAPPAPVRQTTGSPTESRAADLRTTEAFIARWCVECHGAADPKGELSLDRLAEELAAGEVDRAALRSIRRRLLDGDMPPRDPRPEEGEYAQAIAALDRFLAGRPATDRFDAAHDHAPAGRVTARRLSRVEYANSVRDLLGIDFDPERLPADEVGHGFDNNGDVLSISPLLLEKYLDAAEAIAVEAVADLERGDPRTERLVRSALRGSGGAREAGELWSLHSAGEVRGKFSVSQRGTYRVEAVVLGQQAGPEPVRMSLRRGRETLTTAEVTGQRVDRTIEAQVQLEEGAHEFATAFLNDYYKPDAPDPSQRDRNAFVRSLALVGPLDRATPRPLQRALARCTEIPADPQRFEAQAAWLATRAWRRPPTTTELSALLEAVERAGGASNSPSRRLRTLVTALLVHPRFLVRIEPDPPAGPGDGPAHELDAWSLATRLSYFLWSSMPDESLFAAAADGSLLRPEVRRAHVRRMLADPRSLALSEHFATQWLRIRSLSERSVDAGRFPGVDATMLESMRLESVFFFDSVLREGREVSELLTSDESFLNESLARHYGVPGVRGTQLRRVSLRGLGALDGAGATEVGVLRHASVLLATSNPTRTSPVKRGKWVLEAILDEPPPPAPPGVPALPADGHAAEGASLRELLERHRADPECAGCHRRMDAMGFALESFDALGRVRSDDEGRPIDDRAELPGGVRVDGVLGLRNALLASEALPRSLARHLLTYALGRGLDEGDEEAVERILADAAEDRTLGGLVEAVVESRPFRFRDGPDTGSR